MAKVRRIIGTAKKKARNFRRICRKYVLEHKIGVKLGMMRKESVMKWKEKERKRKDFSDILWYSLFFPDILWYSLFFPDILWFSPGITAKRPETTGNDRRIFLWFCHLEEWIPRKFHYFPLFFLGNSPIFPEIHRFSPIFSDILRIFS